MDNDNSDHDAVETGQDDGGKGSPDKTPAPSLVGSRGLWQATLIILVLLIGLGVLLTLFAPTLTGALDDTTRLVLALCLTIIPALLWLALFYNLDRLEPEPHHYVLRVFVLGALIGGAVQQPLLREVFEVQRWVVPGTTTHLLVAILLQGILTASLTYLAVRFSVMPTDEFDERVDGIIYGTAAALGLGVAVNLTYILENGSISLGVGTLTIIITSLAYATFGAIVGYFLGLIKPGGGSSLLAPLGVLIAGVVHGFYEWLSVQFGTGGIGYNPWPSLVITTIFVSLTFAVVFWLIQSTYKAAARDAAKGAH